MACDPDTSLQLLLDQAHDFLFLLAAYTVAEMHALVADVGLRAMVSHCADMSSTSLWHALQALLATFAVAGTLPVALWFLAWGLATHYESSEFAKAIATGLRSVAIIYFTLETLRQLTSDNGMGAKLFGWEKSVRGPLYEALTWVKWILLAGAFLAGAMDFQGNEAFRNAFGRLSFIVPMLVLAALAYRIAHPTDSFMRRLTESGKHQ